MRVAAGVAGPTGRRAAAVAAVAYVGAVAGLALVRHIGMSVSVHELASSPAAVASGRVWRLVTSAFVVAGPPIPQVLQTAAVAAAALLLGGPGLFWRAAFLGHVGATIVAYAGVGALWLVARADVDDVLHAPDYGISCVWIGVLGGLLGAVARRSRHTHAWVPAIAGAAGFAAATSLSGDLTSWEHLIAFVLGAGVGFRARGGPAPDRPVMP
jgi:hypothetical protein